MFVGLSVAAIKRFCGELWSYLGTPSCILNQPILQTLVVCIENAECDGTNLHCQYQRTSEKECMKFKQEELWEFTVMLHPGKYDFKEINFPGTNGIFVQYADVA